MLKIILLLFLPLSIILHDFHITHTTLYYNSDLETMEITIKVSIEDLERSLEINNSEKLRIGTAKEHVLVNEKIENYFFERLKIYTNNKKYNFNWIGKELHNNLHDIYLYFEIPNFNKYGEIKSIKLTNTIFLETEINQTNIVLVEYNNDNFNLTFTKDQETQRIIL